MSGGDTIYALSTAPGKAGVAVVRVSGPQSAALIVALSGRPCPRPRYAALRDLTHDGRAIDQALVLYFAAPASFTGEDMAEFQIHGGRAVARSLEKALEALGSRRAEPGEFSRRAFLNGKIDLTGAEALADLIAAESEVQQAQALAQAGGALERLYGGWSKRLVRALAHVEASLDFADEELPADLLDSVRAEISDLVAEITAHLDDARRGERLRQGFRVAILGAPNAGKSSLLNVLAQRDAAIVSPIAGTTRDVVEVHLDLGGYPVILSDTAGLHETSDAIENEGIARALAAGDDADIRLLLFDATVPRDETTLGLLGEKAIVVLTKIDLPNAISNDPSFPLPHGRGWPRLARTGEGVPQTQTLPQPTPSSADPFGSAPSPMREKDFHAISTYTGAGITEFLQKLTKQIALLCGDVTRPAPTRERHRSQLIKTLEALRQFATAPSIDLAAEDLRMALQSLGRITGRVDVEDLLDVIFRDFCIGK